jgi:O-6-methylguanine DNA methyltransferase
MNVAVRFAEADTDLGPMLIAVTPSGVAAISRGIGVEDFLRSLARRFPGRDAVENQPAISAASAWLDAYLAGARADLPPVDLRGLSRWDAAVYAAVRAIPFGTTATYGEVGAAVGSPAAARAVGGALSRCPLFPAVPCHRVVLAGDGISGWGGGDIALKRRLLDLEGRRSGLPPAASTLDRRSAVRRASTPAGQGTSVERSSPHPTRDRRASRFPPGR